VHRVHHERTGETAEHIEADALFKTLKRALQAAGATAA
jgi:hypothetical protein